MPDIKVVINIQGDRAAVGVQGPDTDPIMETIPLANPERGLAEAFEAAVDVVARAQDRWAASPKNPAYQRPTPPSRQVGTPARAPTPSRQVGTRPASGQEQMAL